MTPLIYLCYNKKKVLSIKLPALKSKAATWSRESDKNIMLISAGWVQLGKTETILTDPKDQIVRSQGFPFSKT